MLADSGHSSHTNFATPLRRKVKSFTVHRKSSTWSGPQTAGTHLVCLAETARHPVLGQVQCEVWHAMHISMDNFCLAEYCFSFIENFL